LHDSVLVEVGSYEGIEYSNTLLLERLAPGVTLLIEPAESSFRECQTNRPLARVYRCAISDRFETVTLLGDSALAGVGKHLPEGYIEDWALQDAAVQEVVALPLNALLAMELIHYVDVLSIDVQGAELVVLEGIDWSMPIGCIVLELEDRDRSKDQACRTILLDNGFEFRVRLGVSEIWTQPHYPRRKVLFDEGRRRDVNGFLFPYLEPIWRESILRVLEGKAN